MPYKIDVAVAQARGAPIARAAAGRPAPECARGPRARQGRGRCARSLPGGGKGATSPQVMPRSLRRRPARRQHMQVHGQRGRARRGALGNAALRRANRRSGARFAAGCSSAPAAPRRAGCAGRDRGPGAAPAFACLTAAPGGGRRPARDFMDAGGRRPVSNGAELGKTRRTHYSSEVTAQADGARAVVMGWVASVRGHGAISFMVVRDGRGEVQVVAKAGECPDDVRAAVSGAR